MGNRYKRMVTLGMISFTALLAWGYCMLAYRFEVVYIAIISLVLVGSVYALLLSVVDIKVAKEQAMQEYVAKTLRESLKQDNSQITECLNDVERLLKASYVQQRKTATYLSAQDAQVDEAVRKAVKLLINYDRKKEEEAAAKAEQKQTEREMQAALQAQKEPDHTALVLEEFGKLAGDVQAVVTQLQQVTAQLTALRESVEAIELPEYVAAPSASAVAADTGQEVNASTPEVADVEMEDAKLPEEDITEAEMELPVADNAEAASTTEPETAFNTEDFFSQFGGSEDQTLKEEAEFKEDTTSAGMMDQSMIDALLGNLSSAGKSTDSTKPADVIPFPQQETADPSTEEAHAEEVAEAVQEVEQDITEAIDENAEQPDTPMVTPIDDNPNRTLTPEEIAALFASMQ